MRRSTLWFGCIMGLLGLATVAQASTTILGSSQDAWAMDVYFASTTTTNYGSAEWIHHYNHDYSVVNPNYPNYLKQDAFSFFQFDLSGLSSTGLVSATFNAYHRVSDYYNSDPTNERLYVMKTYQVLSPWDETTVTYANQPTIGGEVGSTSFLAAAGIYMDPAWEYEGIVSTDVTALVLSWLDGSADNYGFKYKMDNNFLSNGHANMVGTRDNTTELFRPQLVLVYEDQDLSTIPEPASMLLLGSGIVSLIGYRRKLRSL